MISKFVFLKKLVIFLYDCDIANISIWGDLLAPSAYAAGFVSIAHTDEDLNNSIEAAATVFKTL